MISSLLVLGLAALSYTHEYGGPVCLYSKTLGTSAENSSGLEAIIMT